MAAAIRDNFDPNALGAGCEGGRVTVPMSGKLLPYQRY